MHQTVKNKVGRGGDEGILPNIVTIVLLYYMTESEDEVISIISCDMCHSNLWVHSELILWHCTASLHQSILSE